MRGMLFNLQGKGISELAAQGRGEEGIYWGNSGSNKRNKGEGLEPRSVLDNRRSPSPPTSTSTLSSSLGGGGGSSDSAGVAAVSDNTNNPTHKWPPFDSAEDGGGGALRKEEWASELPPIPMGLAGGEKCGLGVEDWDTMLTESAGSPGQEQTFLRWVMGDIDDASSVKHHLLSQGPVEFDHNNGGLGFGLVDPGFGFEPIGGIVGAASLPASSAANPLLLAPPDPPSQMTMPAPAPLLNNPIFSPPPTITNSLSLPLSLPPGMFFQEPMEEKPQLFAPGVLLNHHQQQSHPAMNPAFFLPLPSFPAQPDHHHLLPPHLKRHHSIPLNPTPQITPPNPQDLFLRRNQPQSFPYQLQQRPMKQKAAAGDEAAAAHHHLQQQQHQALVDQLLKAAELAEAGNTVSAREILARLNHHLPSPLGKPLLRSAFFFKEALHLLLADSPNRAPFSTPLITPLDVVFKLSAYKAFSEVSPVLQFTNFTCTQALLEDVGSSDRIHIIDFDIGIGGQWSSFMQELAHRRSSAAPFLKITAFVSPCSYLPLELNLTRDNLSHFASDLNIPFEFSILSIDSFNPAELLAMSNGTDEAVAVNLPVGSGYNPSFPTLLRLVKQLSPKIVVSVDQGCDRSDLPFSHHFLHAFQSCMILLDSIDAAGTNQDAANKIERFLVQPRIENAVLGRRCAAEKMLPWRTLFTSAGFMPVQFSNFTETQAECLLKRVQVRGFHVDKRQASLFLYWQRGELVSVSAWRC